MIRIEDRNLDIRQIADSGQIFRFNQIRDGVFAVRTKDKALKITKADKSGYDFHCSDREYETVWKLFFDMGTDYSRFIESIPKEDRFLSSAAGYSAGMRILRQDPWEMLISFIISQRKSIPAIRTSIEKMCESFGSYIENEDPELCGYAFPTPDQLAAAEMDDILACSVGYRAPYIYEAARLTAEGRYDLSQWTRLSDDELMERLMGIKGVGLKVANCVMLFGYHRIGAFPVDVWIQRMINEHYNGEFPLERYEGFAGVIQQYIFFYGRELTNIKKANKS